jgi:hypothetical protein
MSITDRGVEAAFSELLRIGGNVELQHDARMPFAESPQPRREPARRERGQRRQREARLVHVDRADETRAQRRECLDGFVRDQRAARRQLDSLCVPPEQRHAELPLELAHVVTHGRRRRVQLTRGLRKTAEARRGFESTDRRQRGEFDGRYHKFPLA